MKREKGHEIREESSGDPAGSCSDGMGFECLEIKKRLCREVLRQDCRNKGGVLLPSTAFLNNYTIKVLINIS